MWRSSAQNWVMLSRSWIHSFFFISAGSTEWATTKRNLPEISIAVGLAVCWVRPIMWFGTKGSRRWVNHWKMGTGKPPPASLEMITSHWFGLRMSWSSVDSGTIWSSTSWIVTLAWKWRKISFGGKTIVLRSNAVQHFFSSKLLIIASKCPHVFVATISSSSKCPHLLRCTTHVAMPE